MKLYPTNTKKERLAKQGRIYLDTAATTPVSSEVVAAMKPYWNGVFGNPSSISREGIEARRAVDAARARIATIVGALPREIVFTSGGTEGNNLAIAGVLNALKGAGAASVIEHPSVREPFRALESAGRRIFWISVDEYGVVSLRDIKQALAEGADLISVMYANNEIGTVQPIREIVRLVRAERKRRDPADPLGMHAPFLHIDACQAPGALPIDLGRMGVDLATISAQKFYGPKGVGVLFVRGGVDIAPHLLGGGHERGLRAGTENVPLVVGMAEALERTEKSRVKESARLTKLRDYFIARVLREIPNTSLNGHATERLPGNINITFPSIESELLVLRLDAAGIAVSSGSACGTNDVEPSYVVRALGKSSEYARSAVRFTLGRTTTKKDLDTTFRALKDALKHEARFMLK